MSDRRHAPRVEPRRPLRAKVKASVPVRIVDISVGGAQIELATALRPRVTCELRLMLDANEVIINSVVRRCRAWGFGFDEADRRVLLYRAGVEFETMPAPLIERLKSEYLDRAVVATPAQGSPHHDKAARQGERDAEAPAEAEPAPGPRKAPHKDGPVRIRVRADSIRGVRGHDDN